METVAVIDFETSGLGADTGGRATEVAAVLVRDGTVIDVYASLMNSGAWIPPAIQQLTGISNEMLTDAPPSEVVMRELAEFTQGCPLVAHNAAFDEGFWRAEMRRAQLEPDPAHRFACTVLLSRRLWPESQRHTLSAMSAFLDLPFGGRAHRAQADAEVTAQLYLCVRREVIQRFAWDLGEAEVDHALLHHLQRVPTRLLRKGLKDYLAGL